VPGTPPSERASDGRKSRASGAGALMPIRLTQVEWQSCGADIVLWRSRSTVSSSCLPDLRQDRSRQRDGGRGSWQASQNSGPNSKKSAVSGIFDAVRIQPVPAAISPQLSERGEHLFSIKCGGLRSGGRAISTVSSQVWCTTSAKSYSPSLLVLGLALFGMIDR
jgi:hypothetical protein